MKYYPNLVKKIDRDIELSATLTGYEKYKAVRRAAFNTNSAKSKRLTEELRITYCRVHL